MLAVISPAKALNYSSTNKSINTSKPTFFNQTREIVKTLKKISVIDLIDLMKISPKLAELNYKRFQDFPDSFNNNSNPALFFFDGDVYKAMEIESYNEDQLNFANNNLRILSGLYGILKPFDLIYPYRLEMGINTKKILGLTLYEIWQEKVTRYLQQELASHKEKIIINLASEEYCSVINSNIVQMINIIFKEEKNGQYKIIGTLAKKARGLMVDFIIKNQINKSSDLKNFSKANYQFNPNLSDKINWCFCR